jgi:hypothetical protein
VRYESMRLTGSYADVLGDTHQADDLQEIREYWRSLKEAEHLVETDWKTEVPKRLKGLEEIGEDVKNSLKGLAAAVRDYLKK